MRPAAEVMKVADGTVLDGIPDHRDEVFTAAEQALNTSMMICVSRCQGNALTLDL